MKKMMRKVKLTSIPPTNPITSGWLTWLALLVLALTSVNTLAQTDATGEELPDFADVQRQAIALKQSVLTYGESQRQELIDETEAALENFDRRIDSLESTITARENDMSRAAERYAQSMLDTLGRQRSRFNDWVTALQSDSRGGWDEVMHGFSSAYDDFYNSWEDLEAQFDAGTF